MDANFNIFQDKNTPILMLSYMSVHSPPAFLSLTHLAFSQLKHHYPTFTAVLAVILLLIQRTLQ